MTIRNYNRRIESAIYIALFAATAVIVSAPSSRAATLPVGTTLVFDVRDLEKRNGNEFELSPEIENIKSSKIVFKTTTRDGTEFFEVEKDDLTTKDERVLWTFLLEREGLGLSYLGKKLINKSSAVVSEAWYDYSDSMFNFPKNLCYMYTVPIWLMGKKLEVGVKHDFYILLSYNAAPMHMYAHVTSTAVVTTKAGKFDCYIVRLIPDYDKILGKWAFAKKIISPFVPDFTFWIEKAPPRRMIRFEGKFGPVGGTPTQAYELVSSKPTN